jgi:UDP-N-acetyl-D-mannosaminuronate dehydrogenase
MGEIGQSSPWPTGETTFRIGPLDELGNVVLADADHAIADSDVFALLVDHSCLRAIKKTQLAVEVVYDPRGACGANPACARRTSGSRPP